MRMAWRVRGRENACCVFEQMPQLPLLLLVPPVQQRETQMAVLLHCMLRMLQNALQLAPGRMHHLLPSAPLPAAPSAPRAAAAVSPCPPSPLSSSSSVTASWESHCLQPPPHSAQQPSPRPPCCRYHSPHSPGYHHSGRQRPASLLRLPAHQGHPERPQLSLLLCLLPGLPRTDPGWKKRWRGRLLQMAA